MIACIDFLSSTEEALEDHPLTHTSTRSLLSASSSLQDQHLQQHQAQAGTGTVHSSSGANTTNSSSQLHLSQQQLLPRRSASGGFIGPAEVEPQSQAVNSGSGAGKPPLGAIQTTIASSGSTHFALISGPYSWPKDLLRPGQDQTTLMSWTKVSRVSLAFTLTFVNDPVWGGEVD